MTLQMRWGVATSGWRHGLGIWRSVGMLAWAGWAVGCGAPSGGTPIEATAVTEARANEQSLSGASPVTPADEIAAGGDLQVGPTLKNVEFLRQYAETFRFRAGTPAAITCTPDGKSVLFLRSGGRNRVQDLYEFDVESGQERLVLTAEQILGGGEEKLTAEELARRERMRQVSRGIASFGLSKDGARLLVPLSGKLFVVERATSKITEVGSDAGFPIDPKFSPDGNKIAVVREGVLYVDDLVENSETAISARPEAGVTYGLAEFVAQEEMDRFEGYWWSPESDAIVYQEADTRGLETFTIADPVNPENAAQTWPYPRPGKANAKVRLFIANLASAMGGAAGTSSSGGPAGASGPAQREIIWDKSKYEYLVNVHWSRNAPLTVVVMNREQTEIAILAADVQTGETSTIHIERDPAWLNIDQEVPAWLEDGSGFLWTTERDGGPALELRSRDGAFVRTLVGKDAGLVGLAHVDGEAGIAHLTMAKDPKETHVARLNLREEGARLQMISKGEAVFGFAAGEKLSSYVLSRSDLDGGRTWTVFATDGTRTGELTGTWEAPGVEARVELLQVGNKGYHGAIIRPRDFDRGRKYPVILSVYAGPHVTVTHASSWNHLLNQWFADQGFIVVMLDGRGTPRRGREWERSIRGDLISLALEDQVAGLKALGERVPQMDMERVGVYGWSFGGYFSAMAGMQRPDVFKAACAGAPVADWRDYDTCYTERYLGVPSASPADADPLRESVDRAYERSSVLTYCKDLKVPLLLIHGTADDNVYFMHSLKIADALFKAGKDYEFLVLPGFTHMVPDPVVTTSLYSRVARFFKRELGEPAER